MTCCAYARPVVRIAVASGIFAFVVFWLVIDRFRYVPGHDTEPLDPAAGLKRERRD